MSDPRFLGRRWPDETHLLLLKAALLQGDAAPRALREWEGRVDIERLTNASYALLPLLYFASQKQGIEPREKGRMRGLYRRTWFQNQAALGRARAAVTLLSGAGIETMVLKGTALIALGLVDAGARHMADSDILVPTSRVADAFEILRGAGYTATLNLIDPVRVSSVLHSTELRHEEGGPLDLHWHVLLTSCNQQSDDAFWAAARPVNVLGAPTNALCAADLLLHACSHGSLWTPVPSFKWIADVVVILRNDSGLDWDRFCGQARSHNLGREVLRALQFVSTNFEVPIPAEALRDVGKVTSGSLARAHYALQGGSVPVLGAAGRDLTRYLIISRGRPAKRRLSELPLFFKTVWNISSLQALPAWLVLKARARVRAWIGRGRGELRRRDLPA